MKIDFISSSFLQTFWLDSTPSISRMWYKSKFMEWTAHILRKRLHTIWSNTAGWIFRFSWCRFKVLLIQNHLLLIFKIFIYNSRRSESLKIRFLIREITKIKNIKEKTSKNNEKKHTMCKRKWQQVENFLKTKTFWHFTWFSLWVGEEGDRVKTGEYAKGVSFQ